MLALFRHSDDKIKLQIKMKHSDFFFQLNLPLTKIEESNIL